jgi:hypothetical protein
VASFTASLETLELARRHAQAAQIPVQEKEQAPEHIPHASTLRRSRAAHKGVYYDVQMQLNAVSTPFQDFMMLFLGIQKPTESKAHRIKNPQNQKPTYHAQVFEVMNQASRELA